MRIVKAVFPKLLEVTCFSHTINLLGSHIDLLILDQFMHWYMVGQPFCVKRSCETSLQKERMGIAVKTYSATRWWSKFEVMEQALRFFGDIALFLQENVDNTPRLLGNF